MDIEAWLRGIAAEHARPRHGMSKTAIAGYGVLAVIVALIGLQLLQQPDLSRFARAQAFYADALRDDGAIIDLVVGLRSAGTAAAPDAVERAHQRFDAAVGKLRARLASDRPDRLSPAEKRRQTELVARISASGARAVGEIRDMRAAILADDKEGARTSARAASLSLTAVVDSHAELKADLIRDQHASAIADMSALNTARIRDDILLGGLLLFALLVCIVCVRQARLARLALKDAAAHTEQLALAREAAEAANHAKSAFLTVMSHEIRTPLNGVLGMASALRGSDLTHDQHEMVDTILSSGNLLLGLLNDLLDLSRIEAGRYELEPAEFDLQRLITEIVGLHAESAREKGLELTVSLAPDAAGLFRADPLRLRQVIGNLLGNAIKFTCLGQVRLLVTTAVAADGAARLRFDVHDTGPGFDALVKARLFNDFAQADASITRRFGGSGLGLSICRKLIDLMGGEIGCDSAPGLGSGFWFCIPLERVERAAPREADPEAEAPRSLRILLADDNATNRKVAAALLSPLQPHITVAEDGAEAVAAYRLGSFDIVLMDMQMPVMDGIAATRAIRAHEVAAVLPRTPILAMTANAMAHHVEACRDAGMDGHITKPLQTERLYAALATALAEAPEASLDVDEREVA